MLPSRVIVDVTSCRESAKDYQVIIGRPSDRPSDIKEVSITGLETINNWHAMCCGTLVRRMLRIMHTGVAEATYSIHQ